MEKPPPPKEEPKPEKAPPPPPAAPAPKEPPKRVRFHPLPKIVFLYPTALAGIVCALLTLGHMQGGGVQPTAAWIGLIFLITFLFNLVVLAFDFAGAKAAAAFFALFAVALGLYILNDKFGLVEPLSRFLRGLNIIASPHLYVAMAVAILFIAAVAWTNNALFDYWELYPNELIHRHGVLGRKVERYPTMQLHVSMDVEDYFEWILFGMLGGSGTLMFRPTNTDRPLIVENVFAIDRRNRQIQQLLSKWAVQHS